MFDKVKVAVRFVKDNPKLVVKTIGEGLVVGAFVSAAVVMAVVGTQKVAGIIRDGQEADMEDMEEVAE